MLFYQAGVSALDNGDRTPGQIHSSLLLIWESQRKQRKRHFHVDLNLLLK